MLDTYIELLRPEVEKFFAKDSSGHDISHLTRTMNNALFLQKHEGGDKLVIGVAAFLHDVHRMMKSDKGGYCSPLESLPTVKNFLELVDFPNDKIEKVLHCIEYHEIYNWHHPSNQTDMIEALIVQDADNLDAIGAIGIARTFTYGGAHGLVMYDSKVPLDTTDDYAEESGYDASTIHHFYHKLFKLDDNMNTKTAQKIAVQKTEFMKLYVDTFLNEWNGIYTFPL
jgi:uncharacterized protein